MTDSTGATPRLALVTGSCVRTGRALVFELASRGWHVVVHGKPSARHLAEEAAAACIGAGGQATIALADISTREGCESLAAQIPDVPLGLLVHNVGIYPRGKVLDTTPETLSETLRTNLEAPWILSRLLVPRMERGSSIVAIGYAGLQRLSGTTYSAAYSVSKTGLLVFVRSLALELAPRGIRVNMVSPGQLENSIDLPSDLPGVIPMGRAGTVRELVRTVLWIASDEAAYVTGQDLDIAGGLML